MPSTTVTGQLTDIFGLVWSKANIQISFQPNADQPGPYCWDGDCTTGWQFVRNLISDNGGNFSVSLPDNNSIAPSGSTWRFAFSPNADAPSVIITLPISGPTQDISAQFHTASIAYITQSLPVPRSYAAFTLREPPDEGQLFFDTSNQQFYYWTDGAWTLLVASAPPTTGFVQTNPPGAQTIVQPPGTNFVINVTYPGQFIVNGTILTGSYIWNSLVTVPSLPDGIGILDFGASTARLWSKSSGVTLGEIELMGSSNNADGREFAYLVLAEGSPGAPFASFNCPVTIASQLNTVLVPLNFTSPAQSWACGLVGTQAGGFIEQGGFFIRDVTNNVKAFYLSIKTGNLAIAGSVTAPWFVATEPFTFEGQAELDQSTAIGFDPSTQIGSLSTRSNTSANAGIKLTGYNGSALGHTVIDYITCDPVAGILFLSATAPKVKIDLGGSLFVTGNANVTGQLDIGSLTVGGLAPVNSILLGNGSTYVPTPLQAITGSMKANTIDQKNFRAFSTNAIPTNVYQNNPANTGINEPGMLMVSGAGITTIGHTASTVCLIGPNNPPTIVAWSFSGGATYNTWPFSFAVPPNWFYAVVIDTINNGGEGTIIGISSWIETLFYIL